MSSDESDQTNEFVTTIKKSLQTSNDAPPSSLEAPVVPEPEVLSPSIQNPFEKIAISPTSKLKQVWAIGGGKGGVGKSLISSSLAISLTRMGHDVIAIDLDLGGANLHTTLGAELPQKTLGDFLSGKKTSLQECVASTSIPQLNLISGAHDSLHVSDLEFEKKVKLLQEIRELDTDYVIIDLGAGTHVHTLDFFLSSDIQLITVLPEPTSIENVYRFLKALYFRKLSILPDMAPVNHLIQAAMDPKNPHGLRTPNELFKAIELADPVCTQIFKETIQRFQPKLILNQARTQTDVDIGFSVKSVCKKYFGIDLDYVGFLDYDSSVWQSVRRKRPMMLEFPNSKLVTSIEKISHFLVKKYGKIHSDLL